MGGGRDPRTHAMTHSTLQCGEGRETDGLCLEWTAVGRDCESLLLRNCLFCLVVWGLRRGAGQQLPTLCCYYISHGAAAIVHFVAIKFYILKYYSHLIWISSELTKYVPPTDLVNWRDINILAEYCARYSKYLTVVTGSVHTVGWWTAPPLWSALSSPERQTDLHYERQRLSPANSQWTTTKNTNPAQDEFTRPAHPVLDYSSEHVKKRHNSSRGGYWRGQLDGDERLQAWHGEDVRHIS